MIPAVLIAGTHSGSGKTTVSLALMASFRRRGLAVQPFKVGPDFIDPSHHTAVCGRPSRNLDTFMMGQVGVRRSFQSAIQGASAAVVEGVMGLYDGMGAIERGSTAEVAKILEIPVLLVINVHGMSRSAAAMELGYCSFDPGVKIAGTILNQVGSERHLSMLKGSLKLPILGALPREKDLETKSRHLGLVMGFERVHDLEALAELAEEHLDLDGILKLGVEPSSSEEPKVSLREKVRIGVAQDEAFCFYYYDNLAVLRRKGAKLVPFSPLRDDLPEVDGLYLGGGYPELHAQQLEKGRAREQIKRASQDGMPIYGECGGLMYLGQELISGDERFQMVGALPATTHMTKSIQGLGYVEAEVVRENPVVDMGRICGHEFHYSRMEVDRDVRFVYRLGRGNGISKGWDGLLEHSTLAGYLHAHFCTFKVDKFIQASRRYSRN
jgi:cobyrinic acid a,c-diamide synthase